LIMGIQATERSSAVFEAMQKEVEALRLRMSEAQLKMQDAEAHAAAEYDLRLQLEVSLSEMKVQFEEASAAAGHTNARLVELQAELQAQKQQVGTCVGSHFICISLTTLLIATQEGKVHFVIKQSVGRCKISDKSCWVQWNILL
jgi:hypothetical protein